MGIKVVVLNVLTSDKNKLCTQVLFITKSLNPFVYPKVRSGMLWTYRVYFTLIAKLC